MRAMRTSIACVCVLFAAAVAAPASAQSDFPSRPITIIVPFPPGGSSDVVTRLVAQKLADNLKANVVIDNRGGGGGVPAAIAAKQAAPDGYTLFLANNGLFAIMPALTADIHFDPVKDFQPVTPLFSFPSVLVVPDASPARNVKELVALAKTKPGGLNFASQGVGSGGHILGEMLRLELRRAVHACALSRRRPGGDRPRRRQRRSAVQLLCVGDRPGAGRQAARAGLDRDQALAGDARRSDHGGSRLPRHRA